jgi:hypothetical protein
VPIRDGRCWELDGGSSGVDTAGRRKMVRCLKTRCKDAVVGREERISGVRLEVCAQHRWAVPPDSPAYGGRLLDDLP